MKKWINKQTIIAFLIGGFIFGLVPAYAAVEQYVQAKVVDTKFSVDGKIITSDTQPLNYNNRNLYPIRAVAEAMGGTVEMNYTTNTVEIITKEAAAMNTTPELQENGLPVGAEYIDYDGLKAVKYNEKIYISESDLKTKYGFIYQGGGDYTKIGSTIKIHIDLSDRSNFILVGAIVYTNKDLFNIGG